MTSEQAKRLVELYASIKERLSKGLSRKPIMTETAAIPRRLGTDYINLYQIHRWGYEIPIEKTLEALRVVAKAGKARYIGASSTYDGQFMKSPGVQRANDWASFVSMRIQLNLLYKEEGREMLPLCRSEGFGFVPWSPFTRGRLTRPWETEPSTARAGTDYVGRAYYGGSQEADRRVVEQVGETAVAHGHLRAQVAFAWILHKRDVTAPVVGPTKPNQLEDVVAAVTITLEPCEIASLRLRTSHIRSPATRSRQRSHGF